MGELRCVEIRVVVYVYMHSMVSSMQVISVCDVCVCYMSVGVALCVVYVSVGVAVSVWCAPAH